MPITEFAVDTADPKEVADRLEKSGLYREVKINTGLTPEGEPATVRISGVPDNQAIINARTQHLAAVK